jgi:DNA-binding PadR family transcriptional regulator
MLARSEAVILDLLAARGVLYGLQLVEMSSGALKRGGIYVTLGRMEEKGLVTSASGEAGRRLYEPTALGLRHLVAARIVHGDLPLGANA